MCFDHHIMHSRAAITASLLVVDHGAFGDAETICRLATFVERTPFPNAPVMRDLVVAELRVRAALAVSAC